MSKVTSYISVSLDGFITDPKASIGTPLEGNDPGRLSDWQFDGKTETDAAIVDEMFKSTGAVLIIPSTVPPHKSEVVQGWVLSRRCFARSREAPSRPM